MLVMAIFNILWEFSDIITCEKWCDKFLRFYDFSWSDDLQSELSCFTARRSIIAVYTERDPLSEVWTDVCCPDLQLELHYLRMRVRDFQLSCCRGRHAQSSTTVNAIEASPTTTVSPEIQLINLDHFQPRIRRSPEVTKQKLLVSEQFICPTREGKLRGNLR